MLVAINADRARSRKILPTALYGTLQEHDTSEVLET